VPALLFRVDVEGGVLFSVEGAEAFEGLAGLGEGDVLADDFYDVYFLFYFVNSAHNTILYTISPPHF